MCDTQAQDGGYQMDTKPNRQIVATSFAGGVTGTVFPWMLGTSHGGFLHTMLHSGLSFMVSHMAFVFATKPMKTSAQGMPQEAYGARWSAVGPVTIPGLQFSSHLAAGVVGQMIVMYFLGNHSMYHLLVAAGSSTVGLQGALQMGLGG